MDSSVCDLPEELLEKIVEAAGGSRNTFFALAFASKQLCRVSSPILFSKVKFRSSRHLLEFLPLVSSPQPRISGPVGYMHVSFEDITGMDSISEEIPVIHRHIQARHSLAIRLPRGPLPPTFLRMVAAWFDSVCELTLSGDSCDPVAFFSFVFSFQKLRSLTLVDLSLEEDGAQPPIQFVLPQTVDQLAFIRCPNLVAFFDIHVMSHGWSSIQDLYIQAVFSLDGNGVADMMGVLHGRLQGVKKLTLDALPVDERGNHPGIGMATIFNIESFLRGPGPKIVCLDLAKVPSRVAMDLLQRCARFKARHAVGVVNVHVPTSPSLWVDDAYEVFNSLWQGVWSPEPKDRIPKSQRAKLVVHGFSYPPPKDTQLWDRSAAWGFSRFLLAFGNGDGEKVAQKRFKTM